MSFRWNHSMRQPSERSFMHNGNQLIATSIGITANRTMLSCVLNMDAKQYKYYKSDAQILEGLVAIANKPRRQAFGQIQKFTHYHRDVTNTIFLPEALNHGNYNAMSKFLDRLRTNRVGAYVKLNLTESKGYFQKAATLLKPATKMIRERLRFGFTKLKKNMLQQHSRSEKQLILEELEKISSIENKDSDCSAKANKPKSNIINVSYTLVKINPEIVTELPSKKKAKVDNQIHRHSRRQKIKPQQIDISRLLVQSRVKQYQFQNVDISRIYSARVKSTQKMQ